MYYILHQVEALDLAWSPLAGLALDLVLIFIDTSPRVRRVGLTYPHPEGISIKASTYLLVAISSTGHTGV
jgi:hypothetical protein